MTSLNGEEKLPKLSIGGFSNMANPIRDFKETVQKYFIQLLACTIHPYGTRRFMDFK
jgi:hypothetical protein